jgi:hypothetical protein
MAIEEKWDKLRVDGSWHHTYWVAEWPRIDVRTGFIEPLLYAGDSTRVVTLQARPVPIHKALAQVTRAQNDMDVAKAFRLRFNVRTTREQERETEDLADRENELADGFGDMEFRGFITVSAEDEHALERARSEIEQASHPARIALASMYGQQAAAFVTAALPVPVDGK